MKHILKNKRYRNIFCAASLFLSIEYAIAGNIQEDLQVTANVIASCDMTITSNVAFGDYDPSSPTDLDATGGIQVTCNPGAGYDISIGGGNSGDPTARYMTTTGASDQLNYELKKSDGTNWGTSESEVVSDTADGGARDYVINGSIASGQTVNVGNYTDTVVVTLTTSN